MTKITGAPYTYLNHTNRKRLTKHICLTCNEAIETREQMVKHRSRCSGALEGDLEDD